MGLVGRTASVKQLVDQYYGPLYRFAYRLAGSVNEAEDLTQEAFCKAQQNLSQLRDGAKAKAWLFRILRNVYLHKVRAQNSHPVTSLEQLNEVADRRSESPTEVDSEQLQKALNEMPEGFRTPIVLYYFEDFSYRDIADQMELPIGTVMSRLARAKGFLRARLVLPAPEYLSAGQWRSSDGL